MTLAGREKPQLPEPLSFSFIFHHFLDRRSKITRSNVPNCTTTPHGVLHDRLQMTTATEPLTPVEPNPPPRPDARVGIFWSVPDAAGVTCLVTDSEPLLKAEPYGDFLTHPRGHYDVWAQWRRLGARWLNARQWPLAILTDEYEDHPRGRVVFHVPANTFWIYADRRLQRPATIERIKTLLGLTQETCIVKSDSHYR
jgi:hypothetical protein